MNKKASKRESRTTVLYPKKTIISGLFPSIEKEALDISNQFYVSLAKLQHGMGDEYDFNSVIWRLSAGRFMAYKFFNEDDAEYCHDAMTELMGMTELNPITGKFSTPDIIAEPLREALNLVDVMQQKISKTEFDGVITPLVNWMLRSGEEKLMNWQTFKSQDDFKRLIAEMRLE